MSHFDNQFKEEIDQVSNTIKSSYMRDNHIIYESFTYTDIQKLCESLQCNKAAGFDGITTEYITKLEGPRCMMY